MGTLFTHPTLTCTTFLKNIQLEVHNIRREIHASVSNHEENWNIAFWHVLYLTLPCFAQPFSDQGPLSINHIIHYVSIYDFNLVQYYITAGIWDFLSAGSLPLARWIWTFRLKFSNVWSSPPSIRPHRWYINENNGTPSTLEVCAMSFHRFLSGGGTYFRSHSSMTTCSNTDHAATDMPQKLDDRELQEEYTQWIISHQEKMSIIITAHWGTTNNRRKPSGVYCSSRHEADLSSRF
jgi:hypothetical protein